jgi:hypothetical protein
MKFQFKKGDKVKCLTKGFNSLLTVGEIFTVSHAFYDHSGTERVNLEGHSTAQQYYANRFQLETTTPIMNKEDLYQELATVAFEKLNLKVGDTVRVNGVAKRGQFGWRNTWTGAMDKLVDNTYVLDFLPKGGQVHVEGFNVPFFVIEVVSRAKVLPDPVRISADYDATFKQDGSVSVGCQNVSFATLEQIYNTAKSLR